MKKLFIGTSGYNYSDWKEIFYPANLPQKRWLEYYCQNFDTLEINATFYRSFNKRVFESWYRRTPANFSFTIKGSRYITHIKRLNQVKDEIDRFFENVCGLQEKLAIVLWQFPPNFIKNHKTTDRIENFLSSLPKKTRHAFELRHQSWFEDEIFKLLDNFKAGFVINDTIAFPCYQKITGDFVYVRFHGPQALYSSSYNREQLNAWAVKIKNYLSSYDVYCYFNNDVSGFAVKNARELKNILDKT